jgi:tetratricopeptide (TPR) repeat protein
MKCQSEKNYDGAEIYIKEALKMLKQQNQDKSLGYLYLLNKLGQVSFLNKKYSDSEKYFKVTLNIVPMVTSNPANVFSAQKNLLTLYTHTSLDKANDLVKVILKDSEKSALLPKHLR